LTLTGIKTTQSTTLNNFSLTLTGIKTTQSTTLNNFSLTLTGIKTTQSTTLNNFSLTLTGIKRTQSTTLQVTTTDGDQNNTIYNTPGDNNRRGSKQHNLQHSR
jgi:hypothetical protein